MISIIIPIYNVEKYLRRCIDSVLAQTYTDLQVILVDDGSPDGCGAICDEYAAKDSRIKVIHQENRGLSGARNAGLSLAAGEFVAFLDSDDYVDDTMYEKLLKVMVENDADIAECGYRWVKPDVTYDRENTGKVDVYTNLEALEKLYFGDQMFGGISVVVWNKLYRAELLKGLSFAQGMIHEDVDFTPRALYKARRIAKLNENLHNFFFSPNSISRSDFSLKKLDAIRVRQRVMEFFREQGLQRYFDFMEASYISVLYGSFEECYKRRKQPQYAQKAKELRREILDQFPIIRKNPYYCGSLLRHRIFRLSPWVWCRCMELTRWVRKLRGIQPPV